VVRVAIAARIASYTCDMTLDSPPHGATGAWVRRLGMLLLGVTGLAGAGEVNITVLASDGSPVVGAAVVLEPEGRTLPRRGPPRPVRMDQQNRRFVPEVLTVDVGAPVDFPNSDAVSHQVYSFSTPKRFQLPLYKGRPQAPIVFDKPGLVVLGCNIHDQMAGYIVVTDSPYHDETDEHGVAQLGNAPAGRFRLRVWSPRIVEGDGDGTVAQSLAVGAEPTALTIRLQKPLSRSMSPRPERVGWDSY